MHAYQCGRKGSVTPAQAQALAAVGDSGICLPCVSDSRGHTGLCSTRPRAMPPAMKPVTPPRNRAFAPDRVGPLRIDATLAKVSKVFAEHVGKIICWLPTSGSSKAQMAGVILDSDGTTHLARASLQLLRRLRTWDEPRPSRTRMP